MSQLYRNVLPERLGERVILLYGGVMRTTTGLINHCWKQLNMPDNLPATFDKMCKHLYDLSWLPEKHITIVIHDADAVLSMADQYHDKFLNEVLPGVVKHWDAASGKCVDIVLYSDNGAVAQMRASSALYPCTRLELAETRSGYLTLSLPVLRYDKKKLVLAHWFSAYNLDETEESGMIPRPQMWCTNDIKSGEIINTYHCSDVEFCNVSANAMLDLEFKRDVQPLSKDWWRTTNNILTLVRMEYLVREKFRIDLYRVYLERIIDAMPEALHPFYRQLSLV
ncbi:MAG: hypothetical protein IJZ68_05870 [Bacteroidaceae bacterium]|nr:hypothetical protein [Bacteroidaceae bacterium]